MCVATSLGELRIWKCDVEKLLLVKEATIRTGSSGTNHWTFGKYLRQHSSKNLTLEENTRTQPAKKIDEYGTHYQLQVDVS